MFSSLQKHICATTLIEITLFVVRVPVLSVQMVVADPIVSQAARWRTYYKTQDFTSIFLKTESTPAKVIMEDYAAHLRAYCKEHKKQEVKENCTYQGLVCHHLTH